MMAPCISVLAKGGDPIVSSDRIPFKIGKAMPIREGKDALIVTTGITLGPALKAAEILGKEGIEAAILHMPTVKPLDHANFAELCAPDFCCCCY